MKKVFWNKSYGYTDFISEQERMDILKLIIDDDSLFGINKMGMGTCGPNKYSSSMKSLIDTLRQRIIDLENISENEIKIPTFLESFVSVYPKGSRCVLHTDSIGEKNVEHVRYNVLVSKADLGGENIIDGEIMDIEENTLWRCESGKHEHGTTPILSDKPRIIISIGFYI